MKRILVIGAATTALTLALSVKAEETVHEKCEMISNMANIVMEFRQAGSPMTKMMKEREEGTFERLFNPPDPEFFDRVLGVMISSSFNNYNISAYHNRQQLIVNAFVSEWAAACYDSYD